MKNGQSAPSRAAISASRDSLSPKPESRFIAFSAKAQSAEPPPIPACVGMLFSSVMSIPGSGLSLHRALYAFTMRLSSAFPHIFSPLMFSEQVPSGAPFFEMVMVSYMGTGQNTVSRLWYPSVLLLVMFRPRFIFAQGVTVIMIFFFFLRPYKCTHFFSNDQILMYKNEK